MSQRENDIRIKPGRIRDKGPSAKRAKSFVGQVMRAARKAGHTGNHFRTSGDRASRSTFGRGRFVRVSRGLARTQRRVVVNARIVRHRGQKFRSAPLAKHLGYLKREGVTKDGRDAAMFDKKHDQADDRTFAASTEDDRHHFRFIVSPEDAGQMEDLRAFTRDLMSQAERDLGTELDWVAVDHWNTDNRTFARDLLNTLRQRDLDGAASKIANETGLPFRKSGDGETVAGTYRQRLDLASGRFAMIDDGMGFEVVPWKPQLEKHLGQTVSGTVTAGGGIDWSLGRKRGLSI